MPQRSSLLGLVSVLAPIAVSGNTAVVLTSEQGPPPAVTLSEVKRVLRPAGNSTNGVELDWTATRT